MEDFTSHPLYRRAREVADFVYGLEDGFPEDERPVLYRRMWSSAVDLGARIARAIGHEGLGPEESPSEASCREIRSELCALRHFILTAASRYLIDEAQVATFQGAYDALLRSLDAGA